MSVYGVLYIRRFRTHGLIIDRISVAISVGIFLLCAFAGKPWRRWGVLLIDAFLYALMWFCYEMTRGGADKLGFPIQVEAVRNIDRVLFLGTDPNVWMQQRFYHADDVRWYDNVASVMYYTHFVVPVIALAIVWATSRVQFVRFMRRFASLLGVACLMFVTMPTVPPWMASSTKYHYRLFPPLSRSTGRGVPRPRLQGVRERLAQRTRLGQCHRGDAVAARGVRAVRAGVLPADGQADLAEGGRAAVPA